MLNNKWTVQKDLISCRSALLGFGRREQKRWRLDDRAVATVEAKLQADVNDENRTITSSPVLENRSYTVGFVQICSCAKQNSSNGLSNVHHFGGPQQTTTANISKRAREQLEKLLKNILLHVVLEPDFELVLGEAGLDELVGEHNVDTGSAGRIDTLVLDLAFAATLRLVAADERLVNVVCQRDDLTLDLVVQVVD